MGLKSANSAWMGRGFLPSGFQLQAWETEAFLGWDFILVLCVVAYDFNPSITSQKLAFLSS